MSLQRTVLGLAACLLMLLGAGCGAYTGAISETQYYNDLITQTNSLNSRIDLMNDAQAKAKDASNKEKAVQYGAYDTSSTMANDARSLTIDREASVDIDEGTRSQVDSLAAQYFDLTNIAGGIFAELADYSDGEGYKDDKGKQFAQLEKELKVALDELEPVRQELSNVIEEKQDGIDLGVDESSTDPVDVATLATDTLSSDAEDAQDAAIVWLEEYLSTGKSGKTDDMQSALDTLVADYETYRGRAAEAGVAELTFSGSSFERYMEAINDYTNEYEATVRRINTGELEGIEENIGDDSIIANGLAHLYNNEIVSNHNMIVSSLQSDARSSY